MTAPEPRPAGARWAYLAAFLALGAVTLLGFAAPVLPPSLTPELGPWLEGVRHAPWAPLAAVGAYVACASAGVPQIVLITALVAAFGPWAGLFYSWSGKLIACSIGFAVGRRFGAKLVARHASPRVAEFMALLKRRGLLASALIRLVPTVPSVLVNIAAGATPIRFVDFLVGTALGSVPKMALFAFGGHAAMVAVRQNNMWAWLAVGAALVVLGALSVLGRRWFNRVNASAGPPRGA